MNKNVIWTKGHKVKEFFVFPDDRGGDFVDLIGQIAFVKYFEDVIDPSLHVEISMRLNMKDKFLTNAKKSKIYTSAF